MTLDHESNGLIAEKIGRSAHTLKEWVKKAEIETGKWTGMTTEPADRFKALECWNSKLRRANEILATSAYVAHRYSSIRQIDDPLLFIVPGCRNLAERNRTIIEHQFGFGCSAKNAVYGGNQPRQANAP